MKVLRVCCKLLILCFVISAPLVSTKTYADVEKSHDVILWIRAGLAEPPQFDQYLKELQGFSVDVVHFHIPMQFWNVNHLRDMKRAALVYKRLIEEYERIHIFGYSIGGKFAAKLALTDPGKSNKLKSLFLLDPVDGGPPIFPYLWPHMPVFFTGHEMIPIKTYLLETEFGSVSNNRWGFACVNKKLGAAHFRAILDPARVTEYYLRGAGHLQVIEKLAIDPGNATENNCTKGPKHREQIIPEAAQFFKSYLLDTFTDVIDLAN